MAKWEQEDYEGARDAFMSALEKGAEEWDLFNLLGNFQMALRMRRAGVEYFKQGITMEDNSEELLQEMKHGRWPPMKTRKNGKTA